MSAVTRAALALAVVAVGSVGWAGRAAAYYAPSPYQVSSADGSVVAHTTPDGWPGTTTGSCTTCDVSEWTVARYFDQLLVSDDGRVVGVDLHPEDENALALVMVDGRGRASTVTLGELVEAPGSFYRSACTGGLVWFSDATWGAPGTVIVRTLDGGYVELDTAGVVGTAPPPDTPYSYETTPFTVTAARRSVLDVLLGIVAGASAAVLLGALGLGYRARRRRPWHRHPRRLPRARLIE